MPSRPKLADPGTLIRNGKLPTDTARVCLDGTLVRRYERLVDAQTDARAARVEELKSPSLASHAPKPGDVATEFDADIADLLAAMEATTLELTFTGLSRPRFRALTDKHPPRKDGDGKLTHAQDIIGVAYGPFFDELLRASLIGPVLAPDEVDMLLDERLTDAQYAALATLCW